MKKDGNKVERQGLQAKYKTLVEAAPDGIFTLDLLGRFTFVNPAARRITGYSEQELLGRHFSELLPAQHIPGCRDMFQKLARGQAAPSIEIEFVTKQGDKVALELLGRPVRSGRRVVEVLGISRNITELKRAEEQIGLRSKHLALINEVRQRITPILELTELYERVVGAIQEKFGYTYVAVFSVGEDEIALKAVASPRASSIPSGYTQKIGEGMVGWAARTGRTLLANDVTKEPRFLPLDFLEAAAELDIPIRLGDKTIGVLVVNGDRPNTITETDVTTLETIADQVARAIENAILYEETQRHLATMTTLQRIGMEITSLLDLSTLLQGIADSTLKLVNADYVHLFVLDSDSGQITQRAASWRPESRKPPITWPRKNKGLTATVLKAKEPVVIERAANHPLYSTPTSRKWGVKSVAGFPLKGKWGVTGVLNVVFLQHHTFSRDELQLLALLADQCAIAIQNAHLYKETQQLAFTDGLTALYNRRYFYDLLEKEIQRSERYQRIVSLIILDIDDFKAYNDLHGHLSGDDLLKELAGVMAEVTRHTNTLARYGGEEFAIILPETGTGGGRALAERLLEEVSRHGFSMQDGRVVGRITISIGVATYPDHADSVKALVDAADRAMLRAKRAGKNRIEVCG